ncbi:MAG: hypothetical protein LBK23_05335 [Oscillospiraceae bacterium]|nr:hypothetical protein [Oscillospiraceae bacterium]
MTNQTKHILARILAFLALPVLAVLAIRLFAPDLSASMPGGVFGLIGFLCGFGSSRLRLAVDRYFLKREVARLSKTVTPYYSAKDIFVWRDGGSLKMITSDTISTNHLIIKSAIRKKLKIKRGYYRVTFICETPRAATAARSATMPESDLPLFAELFSGEL